MSTDSPTKQIMYKISSPIHIERGERWTSSEAEAQKAFDRNFDVDRVDIVRTIVSTGQMVTIGLTTEWRGK